MPDDADPPAVGGAVDVLGAAATAGIKTAGAGLGAATEVRGAAAGVFRKPAGVGVAVGAAMGAWAGAGTDGAATGAWAGAGTDGAAPGAWAGAGTDGAATGAWAGAGTDGAAPGAWAGAGADRAAAAGLAGWANRWDGRGGCGARYNWDRGRRRVRGDGSRGLSDRGGRRGRVRHSAAIERRHRIFKLANAKHSTAVGLGDIDTDFGNVHHDAAHVRGVAQLGQAIAQRDDPRVGAHASRHIEALRVKRGNKDFKQWHASPQSLLSPTHGCFSRARRCLCRQRPLGRQRHGG